MIVNDPTKDIIWCVYSTEYKYTGPIVYFYHKKNADAWKANYDKRGAETPSYGMTKPLGDRYESDVEVRPLEMQDKQ